LQIVRSRAKFTNASFQEAASELDFTDSSSLNKMIKKYRENNARNKKGNVRL
jgi:hypothetical protein